MSITIAILALLATFYQAYLQRNHNMKSLKPMGQIVLGDRNKVISVYLYNHGLGPLIIDQLFFMKGDKISSGIEDCLSLDPKLYMHVSGEDSVKRVILPNSYLVIFEKNFVNSTDEAEMVDVRKQLTPITLKVACRDFYDNKITLKRDFQWFSRYLLERQVDR